MAILYIKNIKKSILKDIFKIIISYIKK